MAAVENSINTLGIKTVVTAGTPIQLSTTVQKCNRIWVQPLKAFGASAAADTANAGVIYILNTLTAKGESSTNVIARLDSGENAVLLEAPKSGHFDLSAFWIDAQTSGDGAIISYA